MHGDAALVTAVHQIHRALLREVRVGDDHLVDALVAQHVGELVEPAQRPQAVLGARRERDEADEVHLGPRAAAQRVGHLLDVASGAHQQRAAPIAGLLEHPAGEAGVPLAQHRDVRRAEEQRAVEDVVALEVVAGGQGEDERDHRRLEQGGEDLGQTGASRPIGVQVGAREHQDGEQVGEGQRRAGVGPHRFEAEIAPQRQLDRDGGSDRGRHADEVDDQQGQHPRQAPQRLLAQEKHEQRRSFAPYIALGQHVRHGGAVPAGAAWDGLFVLDCHAKQGR